MQFGSALAAMKQRDGHAMRAHATVVILLLALPSASLFGAEEATDAERLYLEARRSDDQLTQLLAERWYGLVKLQEWTDATGKFHTTAKYLEHDPEMKWVKLLVVKESGEVHVTKEMTIPLDKLDKRCQSRVRQIDHLKAKVQEAMAAATDAAADAAGDEHSPAMERGQDVPTQEPLAKKEEGAAEPTVPAESMAAVAPQALTILPVVVPFGPIMYPNLHQPWTVIALPLPAANPAERSTELP